MQNKRLPVSEEKVMAVIWEANRALDLSPVKEQVNEKFHMDWRPQTVSTFLRRLVEREFLSPEQKGRYVYYTPLVTKEDYVRLQMEQMRDTFYMGRREDFCDLTRQICNE